MSSATFEIGDRVYHRNFLRSPEGTVVGRHSEKDLLLIETVMFYSADTVRLMWRSTMGSVGELRYYWYLPSKLGAGWFNSHPDPDWWIVPKSQREIPAYREFSKDKPDVPWDEIFPDCYKPDYPTMWDFC